MQRPFIRKQSESETPEDLLQKRKSSVSMLKIFGKVLQCNSNSLVVVCQKLTTTTNNAAFMAKFAKMASDLMDMCKRQKTFAYWKNFSNVCPKLR